MEDHTAFRTLERTGTGTTTTSDRAVENHLQYECTGHCRLCPFPGLKCIHDARNLESKPWKY